MEGDKFLVRQRFCDLGAAGLTSSSTPIELPLDNVVVLAGRKVRGAGLVLFNATAFTKVVVVGPPADCYYQAVLSLNTVNLAAAFNGEQQIEVWVDVEVSAPAADGGLDPDRITYQFPVTIRRQAYAGDAPVATGGVPYPAPEQLVVKLPVNGSYRFVSDGGAGVVFQLKNGTTGKYHTLFLNGAEGAETLTWGAGEV